MMKLIEKKLFTMKLQQLHWN